MIWKTRTLGDIAAAASGEVRTGPFGSQLHKADYVDDVGATPVVMPKDMIDGKISVASIARVDDEILQRLSAHRLSFGDIVLARRGDIGRRAWTGDVETGWLCGTGSMRISIGGSEELRPRFLFYFLGLPGTIAWLEGHSVGATMSNLSSGVVEKLPVSFPDLHVQDAIVDVLRAFDDLIENNRRRIEILEEIARLLYREWFVHFRFPGHEDVEMVDSELGPTPEGWSIGQLGAIAHQLGVGQRKDSKSSFSNGSVPVVDQSTSGFLGFHDDEPGVAASPEAPVFTFANHTCAMRLMMEDFSVIQNVFPKVGQPEVATTYFAYHSGMDRQATEEYKGHHPRWRETEVPVAPLELQRAFDAVVGPQHELQWNLIQQNRVLREARDLLLPRLVSGELDVSDLDLEGVVG